MNPTTGSPYGISLEEGLPALRAAREAGRLVPFVGAGISRPYCRGWPEFIDGLYKEFQEGGSPSAANTHPEQLVRNADRVAMWLRLLPREERRRRLCEALHAGASTLPEQAVALAGVPWPLTITTNYDDVMLQALQNRLNPEAGSAQRAHRKWKPRQLRVLGRSGRDCVEVVRSLDGLGEPIIWYVQGHFGKQEDAPSAAFSLLDEVVVGHQQYQEAINASLSFRRAFSEVYRRRSLLFVGSGLAESYVINLIGEALFSLGPSTHPHFALVCDTDIQNGIDPEFLAVRLGITPLNYGSTHNDLRAQLEALGQSEAIVAPGKRAFGMKAVSYGLPFGTGGTDAVEGTVELRFGRLEKPESNGCVILSVGRDLDRTGRRRFQAGRGEQAKSYLKMAYGSEWAGKEIDVPVLPQGRMFRIEVSGTNEPVFLLAARDINDQRDDEARSLSAITTATVDGLRAAQDARDPQNVHFRTVSMGLLAAGPSRADIASFCLIAQLAGIREFARTCRKADAIDTISVIIADKEVWSAVCQGRIPVAEILSSRLVRVLVRVVGQDRTTDEFAMSVPHHWTVGQVLLTYRIHGNSGGSVQVSPLTDRQPMTEIEAMTVFPGMVIDVIPQHALSRPDVHPDAALPYTKGKA